MERIIGQHTEGIAGPLVIVFGGAHGNEPAGVTALQEVFKLLGQEYQSNPGFEFKGKIIGLIGNLRAFSTGQRFIDKDLNRLWTSENIQRIRETEPASLQAEDAEIAELLEAIHEALAEDKPEVLVLLDLHTTSAEGGIFCIPTDDLSSLRLAKALHAPVILGLLQGIKGTLLHFAADNHFELGGYPKHSVGVAFEGGQHQDPLSVSRCISATINCLRAVGCVQEKDVDSRHDAILMEYSAKLPKVTRIQHVHHIRPGDGFVMNPGYINFQPVKKGEILGNDVEGKIHCPLDGLILMPLYQKLGSDGYFLVKEV